MSYFVSLFQKPSNRNELFSFHGSRGRSAVQCRTMERKWPSISGLAGNCIPVFMGIFRGTQERAAVAYVTESNPPAFIWQLTRQQKKKIDIVIIKKPTWISACIHRAQTLQTHRIQLHNPQVDGARCSKLCTHQVMENLYGVKGNKTAKPDLPRHVFRSCHLNCCLSQAIPC